jgi:acyl-[acyl-carrier-protein]-phospholipid O-acyltransferase/long-chain-fatty-acid--[acyl-carrier-protein] ligase
VEDAAPDPLSGDGLVRRTAASTTPFLEVRQAVAELASETARAQAPHGRPLHHAFVGYARRDRSASPSPTRPTRVSRFARWCRASRWRRAATVLCPEQTASAVCCRRAWAAPREPRRSLAGRTIVNLNYTAGPAGLESAARQSGLKTAGEQRRISRQGQVTPPAQLEVIEIGDLAKNHHLDCSRLVAFLIALVLPLPASSAPAARAAR